VRNCYAINIIFDVRSRQLFHLNHRRRHIWIWGSLWRRPFCTTCKRNGSCSKSLWTYRWHTCRSISYLYVTSCPRSLPVMNVHESSCSTAPAILVPRNLLCMESTRVQSNRPANARLSVWRSPKTDGEVCIVIMTELTAIDRRNSKTFFPLLPPWASASRSQRDFRRARWH